jgi:molybdopterin/thiamine biosynthesis adenylyltransferase
VTARNTIVFPAPLFDAACLATSEAVVTRPVASDRGALLLANRIGDGAEPGEVVISLGPGCLQLSRAGVAGMLAGEGIEGVPLDAVRVLDHRWRLLLPPAAADTTVDAAFDRQIRAFGPDGQHLLARLRVGVVGAGGTGSAVCEQLLRLGVGDLLVIDPDVINDDGSNVTRVYGSTTNDIGMPKVEIVARTAEQIGFGTKVTPVQRTINDEDAARLLTDCDVVFGCTDDNRGRLTLSRLAVWYLVPVIDMGVKLTSTDGLLNGIEGRVSVIGPETGCLQCRGRINPQALQAEVLEVNERADRVAEGYAVGLAETDPAVIAFTTGVAAQAVSELLARIFSLDDEPPSTELLMRFHRRDIRRNTRTGQVGHWCTDQSNIGAGDSTPFLGMTWTS